MSDNDVDIEALNRLVSFGSAGDLTQAELSELTKSLGTDDIFGGEEISEGRQEIVTDIEASPPHEIAEIVAGSRRPSKNNQVGFAVTFQLTRTVRRSRARGPWGRDLCGLQPLSFESRQ